MPEKNSYNEPYPKIDIVDDLLKYLPKVSKRNLLFIAGLAWLASSCYLIFRATANILSDNTRVIFRLAIAIPTGIILYLFVFKKIIFKYLNRIFNKKEDKCCFLDFMGIKGYVFLLVMSALNFSIELYKLIALDYLLTFQAIISVPVLLCALMFFRAWRTYQK